MIYYRVAKGATLLIPVSVEGGTVDSVDSAALGGVPLTPTGPLNGEYPCTWEPYPAADGKPGGYLFRIETDDVPVGDYYFEAFFKVGADTEETGRARVKVLASTL